MRNGSSGAKKMEAPQVLERRDQKGDWRFSHVVIPSEVEGSPLQNGISSYEPLWKR